MKHDLDTISLPNGATIHTISIPGSSLVEARFFFNAGFEYFDEQTYQLPHLLEHIIASGGGTYDTEDKLLHSLQDLGASMNASTDYQYITVYLRAPQKNFLQAFSIMLDCVFRSSITQEVLDREREIVIRELYEQHDGWGSRMTNVILSHALHGLVPENWEDYLTQATDTTLEDVKKAYKRCISTKNLHIAVAGRLSISDAATIRNKVRELPVGDTSSLTLTSTNALEPTIESANVDLENNAGITLAFLKDRDEKSTKTRIAYNLALQVLFDAPSAILPLILRKKGLVYSISSDVIRLSDKEIVLVNIMTDAQKAPQALIELMKYLHLYARGHMPAEELASIRRFIGATLLVANETVGDMLEWYGRDILERREFVSVESEVKNVNSVTDKDVAEAVKALFIDSRMYGGIVCKDAEHWASDVQTINSIFSSEHSKKDIENAFEETLAQIDRKRSMPQRVGLSWAAYWILLFLTWVTALRVSQLPLKGSPHTISVLDFALNHNLVWGIAFFVPLALASLVLFVKGSKTRIAEDASILLSMLTSLVYAFGVFKYFGDTGIANQPWDQDAASLIQPFFLFIATPIAFIQMVRIRIQFRNKKP